MWMWVWQVVCVHVALQWTCNSSRVSPSNFLITSGIGPSWTLWPCTPEGTEKLTKAFFSVTCGFFWCLLKNVFAMYLLTKLFSFLYIHFFCSVISRTSYLLFSFSTKIVRKTRHGVILTLKTIQFICPRKENAHFTEFVTVFI